MVKGMKFEAEITQIIQRTKGAKSIRFKKPKDFNYLPGQWAFLTLGQDTKPLSFSSSPTEAFLEVTKRLTDQRFSKALDVLDIGDNALINGPYGNFTCTGEYAKVCMLSGGIGITPLRSMIRYATDSGLDTDIILLYSNRYEDDIPFKGDFEEMSDVNHNFKMGMTITKPSASWRGLTGRITREMITSVVPDYSERVFYVSGPAPMVDAMRTILQDMSISEELIKHEYFTGYKGATASEERA